MLLCLLNRNRPHLRRVDIFNMSYGKELFNIWAPIESPWAVWAKPVLFTQENDCLKSPEWCAAELRSGAALEKGPRVRRDQAIVVDLPGVKVMRAAAQFALAGYRPVPLFNTTTRGANVIVDIDDILSMLAPVAKIIQGARLNASAPPAILLDANRNINRVNTFSDIAIYDNRWLVFPQDFPSADFLMEHGIKSVVLQQEGSSTPAEDLAHVLLRWQEKGLRIFYSPADNDNASPPRPLVVTKPPKYRSWMQRLSFLTGLRRNSAGGFGANIPIPNSGSQSRIGRVG